MSSSSGSSDQNKEYVFNTNLVPLFTNLTFHDVSKSFTEYRTLLQQNFTPDIFGQLNDKLDEIEYILVQKEADIQAARAASHKFRLQLYSLETQYYQDPTHLHVVDSSFNKDLETRNDANPTPHPLNSSSDNSEIQSRPISSTSNSSSSSSNSIDPHSQNVSTLQNKHVSEHQLPAQSSSHPAENNPPSNDPALKQPAVTGYAEAAAKSSAPPTPEMARVIPASSTKTTSTNPADATLPNASSAFSSTPINSPVIPHHGLAATATQEARGTSQASAGRTSGSGTSASSSSLPWHINNHSNSRFFVLKLKGHTAHYSNSTVDRLISEINATRTNGVLISSGAVTKRGNIRLSFAPNVTYHDLELAHAIPNYVEPIDCSDWLFLSVHRVPMNKATGKPYTGEELRSVIEGFGLKLARAPEVMSSTESKITAKISFSTIEERDAAYFMRAFYFEGQRARLSIFPDEWTTCDKIKVRSKTFGHGQPLADLMTHDHKLRMFQTNCKFDLQLNHEILFETVHQAHIVLVEGCWKHSDGRPLERQDWTHFYKQYYYEQGGTRMALYASRRPYSSTVSMLNINKPFLNVYYVANLLLIQVDRPSDLPAYELFETLQEVLQDHSDDKDIVIAGCFNMQHKLWDGSEAPPEMYANRIADLLQEYSFKRLSPFPSRFIDNDNYYTNPTVLFAQSSIANLIHVHNKIKLSDDILEHIADYHYLSWDVDVDVIS